VRILIIGTADECEEAADRIARVLDVVGEALAAAGLDGQAVEVSGVERSHLARKARLGGLQPLLIHNPAGTQGDPRSLGGTRENQTDGAGRSFLGTS
jgi:hypothetical protein